MLMVYPVFCFLALRQMKRLCISVCVRAPTLGLYRAVMTRMMHPIPISVSPDLSEPCWVTAWQNLNPEEQFDGPNTH